MHKTAYSQINSWLHICRHRWKKFSSRTKAM